MARPLRLHVPNGFYHVTLRGNHRQAIFFCEEDRDLLDRIVAESLEYTASQLHAYCWMTNHIHMLVQVGNVPLGRLILRIASQYARKVQTRLQTTGHLFERRYHAVLVDADSYLMTLIRYIHLNPVRGGLVSEASQFPWSSHGDYLGHRKRHWVHTAFALQLLAPTLATSQQAYWRFMAEPDAPIWGTGPLTPNVENSQVLGDDAFAARVMSRPCQPQSAQSLDSLLEECSRLFHVTPDALCSQSRARHLGIARAWLAHEAISRRIATISTIARRLGRNESAIRRLMERHRHVGR